MLFLIMVGLMFVATIVDGWSQHRMLTINGGKGYEVTSIYGKFPTYFRYFAINLPALVGWSALMYVMNTHHLHYVPFCIAFVVAHMYGFYLNAKNF